MDWIGLDIGGANLKVADGRRFGRAREFPLWRKPGRLVVALGELLAEAPAFDAVAVTMTGELADCYRTKREGVESIATAAVGAARGRLVRFYNTAGRFVSADAAVAEPLGVAAANWHALAVWAARFVDSETAMLFDVGSTTTDLIPLFQQRPVAMGRTDPERLAAGELVYAGVRRTPICALVDTLPWRESSCAVAAEVFATTFDAYLVLGFLPEQSETDYTADGRPATREAAADRLARMICADGEMLGVAELETMAEFVLGKQLDRLERAASLVAARLPRLPEQVVISGSGEFLARRLIERLGWSCAVRSLSDELGPVLSQVAPAHALAVLAQEQQP